MNTITDRLLRETIRQIIHEQAGPGKIGQLVDRLVEINAQLSQVGVPLKVGISVGSDTVSFAGLNSETGDLEFDDRDLSSSDAFRTQFLKQVPSGRIKDLKTLVSNIPWGSIGFKPARDWVSAGSDPGAGKCSNAAVISYTESASGWGPLLYDIAIEAVGMQGMSGLAPDRESVSSDARRVWSIYSKKRSDVKKTLLDIDMDNTEYDDGFEDDLEWSRLTRDDDSDDCMMTAAYEDKGVEWYDSPLANVYTKPPTVIPRLQSLGLLVMV